MTYNEPTSPPVEKKVTAAGATALITAWLMTYVLQAVPALAALNDVLAAAIGAVVTAGLTWVVAFWTKHTFRPDLGEAVQRGEHELREP
jgi:hypothetical protein